MTDEQIKELCRRVNRIVLDDEPDTFQTLSDLALAGNERARDCLSIYYGMSNLALDHNMEWAFREVVSDPLAYFYNGEEYLEFLCDYAEKDFPAVSQIFAQFKEEEWGVVMTYISPKQPVAAQCIARHFAELKEEDRKRAFAFVQEAAALDFPEAYDAMAFCLAEGFCTDYDLQQSQIFHQKAVEAGVVYESLGVEEKIAAKEKEIQDVMDSANTASATDVTKANELMEEAAKMGSQEARERLNADYYFNLALACREGKGVEKSPNLAFRYFKEAAKQEHLQALFEMGVCIAEGKGTYKNWEKGLAVINQAAEAGNADAIAYLADKDKLWNKIKRAF